jgi:hypothetical protein
MVDTIPVMSFVALDRSAIHALQAAAATTTSLPAVLRPPDF